MNLQDAISVIESAPGFTDETTLVGEAWAVVLASLNPAPTPVPVTERLPGPGDCDALGYCWWWDPFRRESWEYCITGGGPDWYWLPFNALSLPAGEVE